jgi:hypothetical protein
VWPPAGGNTAGSDIVISASYNFTSMLMMFAPGTNGMQFSGVTFTAKSRQVILFDMRKSTQLAMRTSGLDDDAVADGDPGNAGSGGGLGMGLLPAASRAGSRGRRRGGGSARGGDFRSQRAGVRNPAVWCGAATNCPATAPSSPSTSFDNACMLASANGFTTSGIDTVSVQAGISSPVPTVSGPAAGYWAVVRVNETLPALFGAAFARGGFSPGAIATAGAMGSAGAGSCIYVLDPSAADAFEAGNGASVAGGLRHLCRFQ